MKINQSEKKPPLCVFSIDNFIKWNSFCQLTTYSGIFGSIYIVGFGLLSCKKAFSYMMSPLIKIWFCQFRNHSTHRSWLWSKKERYSHLAMAGRQDVSQLVSRFEAGPDPVEQQKDPFKGGTGKCTGLMRKFLRSRFMGLAFGPAYGLFIYLYITHLILAGAPFTKERTTEN